MLNLLNDGFKSKHLLGRMSINISRKDQEDKLTFPQQPPNIRETIIPTFNHMGTVAYAAAAAVDNQLSFVSSSILYRSWVALEGTSNPSLKRDGEGVRSGAAVQ
jgi:hypothetical protein